MNDQLFAAWLDSLEATAERIAEEKRRAAEADDAADRRMEDAA